jgi:NAD(P)-dependent dehydrogenase (short-subunit alcohol dehydrogenase family)
LRFAGKTVLITGGATGIGLATAWRFAEEGASVAMMGRRESVGTEAAEALRSEGYDAMFVKGDVAKAEEVQDTIKRTIERFGQIDILVNNAATFSPMKFADSDTSAWRGVFDVIAHGTYLCSKAAAQHMIERGVRGHIVNVSSINSTRALEESSHYNAAKGALDQLTRCMAVELIDYGIRVNSVNPGFIDTPMSLVDGVSELETDWFRDIYVGRKKIPQRRAGLPSEVAAVIAFLASEDASYLCGATIPVDGGLSVTF